MSRLPAWAWTAALAAALRRYTEGGAYARGQEAETGRGAPGLLLTCA